MGAIPVFFEGVSEGDETRRAWSRTLFGTDAPDRWSVPPQSDLINWMH